MRWRTTVTSVLLVAGIGIAGAGCAVPPAAGTAAIGTGWFDDGVRILGQFRAVTRPTILAGTHTPGANSVVRGLDDVVARAPEIRFRTPEVTRRLDDLVAAQQVARQFDATVAVADLQSASVPSSARNAARSSTNDPSVSDELTAAGEEIIRDATCDVVGDALLPSEQEDVDGAVRRGEAVDDRENVIEGAAGSFGKAAGEYAARRVAGLFGRGALGVVAWGQWESSVRETVTKTVANRNDLVATPSGTVTRAYVQYVRICLRPPR